MDAHQPSVNLESRLGRVARATHAALVLVGFLALIQVATTAEARQDAPTPSIAAPPAATPDPTVTELNKQKLDQEVEQLRSQNVAWSFTLRNLTPIVIPVAALIFGAWRLRADRQNERRKQFQDWLHERERRDEDRFQNVVTGLGSEVMQAKIAAAVMLRTFLQPEYRGFHIQAFDLVVGSLRCLPAADISPAMQALREALTKTFKDSYPKARAQWKVEHPGEAFGVTSRPLDATGINLDKAFFFKVDLRGAFMPETSLAETDLTEACLADANLWRASCRGRGLKLHKANLAGADLGAADLHVEATLNDPKLKTDLSRADFSGARLYANLSGANLSGAVLRDAELLGEDGYAADLSMTDLSGVDLSNADLPDVNLCGAVMDSATQWSGAKFEGARYNSCELRIDDEEGNVVRIRRTTWPTGPSGEAIIPAGAIDVCQQC